MALRFFGHYRERDIVHALEHGFDDQRRRRAFGHLGDGCRVCWRRLEGMAHQGVAAELGEAGRHDLMARALARSIASIRCRLEVPVLMTPGHLYWARQVAHEPGAFARLALEEAVLLELEAPREGFEVLKGVIAMLESRRLGLRPARRHDLAALAHVYLSHALMRRRDFVAAGLHLGLAAGHRRRGSGDAEVRAIELILGSWVEAEAGLEPEAGERLLVAEHVLGRFLGSRRSPGHLADLRAHQGLNAARHGRYETARESYREALALLPEECVYARNFVTLSLAALALALGDSQEVTRYLAQAGRLAEHPGFAAAADTRESLRAAISRLEARIH